MDAARIAREGINVDVAGHDPASHLHGPNPGPLHRFVVPVGAHPDQEAARGYRNGHVTIDHESRATEHLDLSDRRNALKRGPHERKVGTIATHPHTSERTNDSSRSSAPIGWSRDRKSTRLNSSHVPISYAVFCLEKKTTSP